MQTAVHIHVLTTDDASVTTLNFPVQLDEKSPEVYGTCTGGVLLFLLGLMYHRGVLEIDVEVDITCITFMMRAQYKLLVTWYRTRLIHFSP